MERRFINKICEYFGTTYDEMYKKRNQRYREYVIIRQFIFYYLRKYTKKSLREIGQYFNKNHASVLHSVMIVENLLTTDKQIKYYNGILEPIAIQMLDKNFVNSVKRRYKIDEIYNMIELSLGTEQLAKFKIFNELNEDMYLKTA